MSHDIISRAHTRTANDEHDPAQTASAVIKTMANLIDNNAFISSKIKMPKHSNNNLIVSALSAVFGSRGSGGPTTRKAPQIQCSCLVQIHFSTWNLTALISKELFCTFDGQPWSRLRSRIRGADAQFDLAPGQGSHGQKSSLRNSCQTGLIVSSGKKSPDCDLFSGSVCVCAKVL